MSRLLAVLMLALVLGGQVGAQDLDARALALLAAPHVNEATQAVGHVDVQKLDLKKYFEVAAQAGASKEIAATRDLVLAQHAKLVKAGLRQVVAVVNVPDPLGQPVPDIVVLAPLGKDADGEELLKLVGQVPMVTAKIEKEVLVARFGSKTTDPPDNRPEFAEGLTALRDRHIQLVVAPSADARRIAARLMPNLPAEVGGGDVGLLTEGVLWIGIGLDTNPLTQTMLVQVRDAQRAGEVKELIDKALDALARTPQARDLRKLRDLLQVKQQGERVTLVAGAKVLDELLRPSVVKVREASARTRSQNNLKQMGLGLHNYHDVHGMLPARASFDAKGKPLLSWRVHILPYVEQAELYQQFKLDEPWDSPHNKKLIARMPALYASPLSKVGRDGKTTYLAATGKGSMFDGKQGVRFADVTDGLSNTIVLVEANDSRAVFWTQPEDFPIDTKAPLQGLVLPEVHGFNVVMADGSVRFVAESVDLETLRALLTRDGNEAVNHER